MANAEGKQAFESRHEQQWPGIADLYRKVFLYQMGHNSDGFKLHSLDSGSCIWRKRVGCEAHEPWRGHQGMRLLLDLWPGGVPPPLVPSVERPGSYARPGERYDLRERFKGVVADQYNPQRILDGIWKKGLPLPDKSMTRPLQAIYLERDGQLPENVWELLKELLLASRKTIAHYLAHLAALARGDEAVLKLEAAQKAQGIDKAVNQRVQEAPDLTARIRKRVPEPPDVPRRPQSSRLFHSKKAAAGQAHREEEAMNLIGRWRKLEPTPADLASVTQDTLARPLLTSVLTPKHGEWLADQLETDWMRDLDSDLTVQELTSAAVQARLRDVLAAVPPNMQHPDMASKLARLIEILTQHLMPSAQGRAADEAAEHGGPDAAATTTGDDDEPMAPSSEPAVARDDVVVQMLADKEAELLLNAQKRKRIDTL